MFPVDEVFDTSHESLHRTSCFHFFYPDSQRDCISMYDDTQDVTCEVCCGLFIYTSVSTVFRLSKTTRTYVFGPSLCLKTSRVVWRAVDTGAEGSQYSSCLGSWCEL